MRGRCRQLSRQTRVTILLATKMGPYNRGRMTRYGGGGRSLYPGLLKAGYQGARTGMKLGKWIRNFRQSRNARTPRSGGGITTQHDRTSVYRKKSMPRYKKKAWRRFVKKTHAAVDKGLGSFTVVKNNSVTITNTINTTDQGFKSFALYPLKDGTNDHLNDMAEIASELSANVDSTKWRFASAVFDLTLQNVSLDASSGGAGFSIEVDIYEMSSRDSWETLGTTPKALENVIADGWTNTVTLNTSLTLARRGVTPFDATQALSVYKLKIWKKTKYFLSYGNTITYQMRDPKTHFIDQQRMEDGNSDNWPGVTRWLLVIAKPTPGVTLGVGGQLNIASGVTRKYLLKKLETSTDTGGWF